MLASHSSVDIWLGQHWKSACGKSETWVTVAGENCVWAKKETTAATTTKRRCLGAWRWKKSRFLCKSILFVRRFLGECRNWKRLPVCLQNPRTPLTFCQKVFWPLTSPHPQNLHTAINRKANMLFTLYINNKHGVNVLFFVTHWKGERGATKLTSVTADRVQHLWNLVSDKDQHEKLSNYPITSLLGIVGQS